MDDLWRALTPTIIQGDAVVNCVGRFADVTFADIPDNLGLNYEGVDDNLPPREYENQVVAWLLACLKTAPCLWWSFNARYTVLMGHIVYRYLANFEEWNCKPCVQTFTFGRYNPNHLGNNHRPLWLFWRDGHQFYPDQIRVTSARQRMGDKRANPGGRVPGDVFDFPRVVGNSRQRRKWHPTQLNEGLVERCLLFSCKPAGKVLDPFAGTGTTGRVCQSLGLRCTLIEKSPAFVSKLKEEFYE